VIGSNVFLAANSSIQYRYGFSEDFLTDSAQSQNESGQLTQKGKEIIPSGQDKAPVARLEASHPMPKKRLGALETPGFELTDASGEPLPDEDLRLWNGEGE
jgi:hypothetical protein